MKRTDNLTRPADFSYPVALLVDGKYTQTIELLPAPEQGTVRRLILTYEPKAWTWMAHYWITECDLMVEEEE